MVVDFKAWFENPLKEKKVPLLPPLPYRGEESQLYLGTFRLQSYHKT